MNQSVTGVSRPVPTARSVTELFAWAREVTGPALCAAVDRLPAPVRRVCGYHLGWLDSDGEPARADAGKAVRPALVLLAAEAAGGLATAAVPAAVAVELLHNFSLLHDDVMDRDALRRGRPAVWSVFGVPAAVLAGDALLPLAFDALAEAGSTAAVRMLAEATFGLVDGQTADLAFEQRRDVGIEECLRMAAGKTGALLAAACALGAMAVGAPPERVGALRGFGLEIGIGFQCVDDLLGIWGDPAVTGKPVHADLAARKKSLPVVAALTSGRAAAVALARLYDRPTALSPAELVRAARLVAAAGGRDWTRTQAAARLDAALIHLGSAELDSQAVAELMGLAHLLVARDH